MVRFEQASHTEFGLKQANPGIRHREKNNQMANETHGEMAFKNNNINKS